MTYVAFKVGRGGRFHNPGYISFYGEMTFAELVKEQSNDLFLRDRDEHGRFCKRILINCSGNVVSEDDINGNTGCLDFDGDYDKYYVKDMQDMSQEERDAVRKENSYISEELTHYIKSYNDIDGVDDNE